MLTHQHMDHLGLLEILARRSGAEVAALDLLGPYLADFVAQRRGGRRVRPGASCAGTACRTISRPCSESVGRGVPRVRLERARHARRCATAIELELRDRTLEVLHRPGHSPSDTIFWDSRAGDA